MATLEDLKTLYAEYIVTAEQVQRKAPALAGFLGLGNDPRKDRCHDEFFAAAEAWSAEFLAAEPSQAEATEAVRFILHAAHENSNTPAYWYLYAVQGVTRPLIPLLAEETCRELAHFYDEVYPAMDRPPVQREVYKLLQQYAGQKVPSGSFLQRLFGKK